jgi:hypothetical protein
MILTFRVPAVMSRESYEIPKRKFDYKRFQKKFVCRSIVVGGIRGFGGFGIGKL